MIEPRDPFRWLEDAESHHTRGWLVEQADRAEKYLGSLPSRDWLAARMRGLVGGPTASREKSAAQRRFRVRRADVTDTWALQVADGPGERAWRTVLTPAELGDRAVIRRWEPSPDGRFVAVQATMGGTERTTPLSVVDVDSGRVVDTCLGTRYSPVAWLSDTPAFLLVRRHRDRRGAGVYLHRVGTPEGRDELVLGDGDPVTRYHFTLWHGRWLVVGARRGTSKDAVLRCADLASDAEPKPLPLSGCSAGAVTMTASGRLLALSTDGAEYGRLLAVAPDGAGGWTPPQVVLDETPPAVLEAVAVAGAPATQRLAVLHTVDGYSELSTYDPETGARQPVRLPGQGTISALNQTGDPDVLSIGYTDWATTHSVWRVDVRTGRVAPADPAQGGRRPMISVYRASYRSHDGVDVPLTLLGPAGAGTGPRPTLLTCYGGFGISFRPSFQPDGLTWVLAGGVMAIAAVRGGGERGRRWHRDGAGPNKPNALHDLQAAADWLVDKGLTTPDRLALLGGSNGGMVAAGTAVRRPDAYRALVIGGAPLDMVRYERWGLGPSWREEYGTAADQAGLATLLSYSPYHNVEVGRGRFPATLLVAGTEDTRVDPVHSRKMAAKLQDRVAGGTTGGPVLLRMVEGGGHLGGGSDEVAVEILAFLAHHTGLEVDADG